MPCHRIGYIVPDSLQTDIKPIIISHGNIRTRLLTCFEISSVTQETFPVWGFTP